MTRRRNQPTTVRPPPLGFLVNALQAFGRVDGIRTRNFQVKGLMLSNELPIDAAPLLIQLGTRHADRPLGANAPLAGRHQHAAYSWPTQLASAADAGSIRHEKRCR